MIKSSIEIKDKTDNISERPDKNNKEKDNLNSVDTNATVIYGFREFQTQMKEYDDLCQSVYLQMRRKISEIEKEIDEIYESGEVDPQLEEIRKKRKRNNEKILLRKVSPSEALEDLNEIRGIKNTIYVSVNNGVLKVEDYEFKKRDSVKVDMHGENFNATLLSISPKSIVLRTKNGKKYNILVKSIKREDVKLIKTK